jgi:ATP-dependent Clp protease ATP-binding subunit ClpA
MFERYTEAARRTLFFARYEASQLGSVAIEPAHMLLGLLRDSTGVTRGVFTRSGLTHENAYEVIRAHSDKREKVATSDGRGELRQRHAGVLGVVGTGLFPFDASNEAYKLGVNCMIHGLTH